MTEVFLLIDSEACGDVRFDCFFQFKPIPTVVLDVELRHCVHTFVAGFIVTGVVGLCNVHVAVLNCRV